MMAIASRLAVTGRRGFVACTVLVLAAATLVGAGLDPVDAAGRQQPAPGIQGAQARGPRITGVETVTSVSSVSSRSVRSVAPECDGDKVIVGGGASVVDFDAVSGTPSQIVLTRLAPVDTVPRHRYAVTAAELFIGTTHRWGVVAYAVCADPVPGYEVVHKVTSPSSASVQTADPVCDSGKSALGSGAMIIFPLDQPEQGVALQVARADARGGLTRTQAHEQPAGYIHNWQLVGYAICANTPEGFEVVGDRSEQEDSEDVKEASVSCPDNKQMLGVGGAISNVAPGHATLISIVPSPYRGGSARVTAVESTPTSRDWDFIVVRGICVNYYR